MKGPVRTPFAQVRTSALPGAVGRPVADLARGGARSPLSRPEPSTSPTDAERGPMELAAIVTLVLIGGFVWGGLVVILTSAVRKERVKGGEE